MGDKHRQHNAIEWDKKRWDQEVDVRPHDHNSLRVLACISCHVVSAQGQRRGGPRKLTLVPSSVSTLPTGRVRPLGEERAKGIPAGGRPRAYDRQPSFQTCSLVAVSGDTSARLTLQGVFIRLHASFAHICVQS